MQTISEFFVRPQRQKYFVHDLGPSVYFNKQMRVKRQDFKVLNNSGKELYVSLFENEYEKLTHNCVVYLHTHHGSRLEGLPIANRILQCGANFCLFDFAGYGNSQGQKVTLGCQEKMDIAAVLQELRLRNQKKFILWGRSMGAVAALLYNQFSKDSDVLASVYDSPFASLQKLTLQLGAKNSGLPECLLKPAVALLKYSLKEQLDFSQLELTEKAKNISVPGFFLASKSDSFIGYAHSEELYNNYQGKKYLHFISQDHNQNRIDAELKEVYRFVKKQFGRAPGSTQNNCNSVLLNNLRFQVKGKTSSKGSIYKLSSPSLY